MMRLTAHTTPTTKRRRRTILLPLYLSVCLPLLASCLSEDPRGALEEGTAYTDATVLELGTVADIYNYIGGNSDSQGLQGTSRGVYDLNTFTTDEAMLPTRGGDWYDGGLWQGLYLHTWTPSEGILGDTWNYLYKVIMLCNLHLETLEANKHLLTESQLEADKAELRSARALFYFYTMDLFGRIPIVTNSSASADKVKQSSRSEAFRFIIDELQTCVPLLSTDHSSMEGNYYSRITRPVVYFLLAKMLINAEIYADDDWTDSVVPDGKAMTFIVDGETMNAWEACIAYCDKLEGLGYRLEEDFTDNFALHNEKSHENIFTIPMDKYLYANQFQNLFRSRHYSHGSALGMDAWNGTSATVSTMKAFGYGTETPDTRMPLSFYYGPLYVNGAPVLLEDGTQLVYEPMELRLDLSNSPYEKTAGARMKKYETDQTAYADGKLQSNDIVLFRYADVLLMKGEALYRNGGDGSEYINKVRKRVNMPPVTLTAEEALDAASSPLLDERLKELVWEGWRRNDLIRFHRFHTAYDQRPQAAGEENAFTTVFPIPGGVLDHNANLTQNPGY